MLHYRNGIRVRSGPVTITIGALNTVLRLQDLGELPVAIAPNPIWTDPRSDREFAAAAWTEFSEVGWLDDRGQVDDDALDYLHALARPMIEYTALVEHDGRTDAVVVAGRGDCAMVAHREDMAVTLVPLRHVSLPETLLRQVPDADPAPIGSINIALPDLVSSGSAGEQFAGRRSRAATDARKLGRLAALHATGGGELYVAVRDPYGRHRTSEPVRYQDYPIGRILVVTRDDYVSIAPASKALLLTRLREVQRSLNG